MRGGVLLAAFLAAGAGAAAAQAPPGAELLDAALEVAVPSSPRPIAPLGPFAALEGNVTYRYQEVTPETAATEVTVEVAEAPPWAVTTLSPETVYFPRSTVPCGCERALEQRVVLLVSTTGEAPAFQSASVTLHAAAPAHGPYRAAEATQEVAIVAGYHPALEATAAEPALRLGLGERRDAAVAVTNLANGASTIAFRLGDGPPQGIALTLPEPFVLGARQQGEANERTVRVGVEAVGAFVPGNATLEVTASSSQEPGWPAATTRLTLLLDPLPSARPAGDRAAPDVALPLALGALLLAGLVRGKRGRAGGGSREG